MIIPFRLVEITIIDKNLGICFKNNLSLGTQWYDHPETEILVREAFFSCNLVSSQSWHSSEKAHRIPLLHSGIPKASRFKQEGTWFFAMPRKIKCIKSYGKVSNDHPGTFDQGKIYLVSRIYWSCPLHVAAYGAFFAVFLNVIRWCCKVKGWIAPHRSHILRHL